MMTKEKAWQLAEEAGMDKEKFVSLLQKEGVSEEVMEEELDNVCGGDLQPGTVKVNTRRC